MILEKTKEYIKSNLGRKKNFVYHGVRNQNENFSGVIIKLFPAVFLIELDNGQIRSYSYNDVLISNLEILD